MKHDRLNALLGYLRTCRPVDRTSCFFIYRFPADRPAGITRAPGR
jgi:hypothetical protein